MGSVTAKKVLFFVSVSLSIATILVGVGVILGWYTHQHTLIQIHSSFVPMQYNTALGFLLSGVSLLLFQLNKYNKFSQVLGGIVFLIGFLTLSEYIFKVNFGIDELFMDHYIGVKTSHPGRMAPSTALCFLLFSNYLFGVHYYPRGESLIGILSSIVLALGFVAFVGYVFEIEGAYGWGKYTRMALHTAVLFIFLSISSLVTMLYLNNIVKKNWYDIKWLPPGCFIATLVMAFILWNANITNAKFSSTITLIEGLIDSIMFFIVVALIQRWRKSVLQLQKNNIFINSVIDNIPSVMIVQNAKTSKVEIFNRAGEEAFSDLQKDDIANKIISSGTGINAEETIDTGRGERCFQTKSVLIKNEKGKIGYLMKILDDITDKKYLEKEIETARQEKEKNARIISLGVMAGGVAHEINNPLAIISLTLSQIKSLLLKKGSLNKKVVLDKCKRISATIERISIIVKGLKNISRDSKGDPMQHYNLKKIVDETIGICREKLSSMGIKISLEGNFEQNINCRKGEVSQVLFNLISNSYDAIEEHELEERWIKIKVCNSDEKVKVSVIDSGNGIDSKDIDKIMNPFYTTKDVGKGTGLGLSISHSIMKTHNGSLVFDEHSSNTKFDMIFPAIEEKKEVA